MTAIVWAGFALLLLAWAFARRRSIRRWWRTKPCPHPDCVGRLPAEPLTIPGVHNYYAKEQCEVCQNWVQWDSTKVGGVIGGYIRVKGDE